MKNVVFGLLATKVASQGPCESTQVGVNLHQCPLPQWKTSENPTSLEEPLQMVFRVASHTIPLLNQETDTVIPGETVEIRSRTYHFDHDGFEPSLPPPTMVWEKGAEIHMLLRNEIHIDYFDGTDDFILPEEEWLDPHHACNIHTHGLHIDSFSDDPSREIHVNESGAYFFELPEDHGGGMHWYHPHIEQTSEITLSGGGFGALIVETDPNGLEIPQEIHELEIHDLLINRFYPAKLIDVADGYFDAGFLGTITGNPRQDVLHPDFEMIFSNESTAAMDELATDYTLVNGYLKPKVVMQSGEWYRYRMVYVGGLEDETGLSDVKIRVGRNQDVDSLGAESDYGPFDELFGTSCETKLIAKDGVYLRESRYMDFDAGDRIWLSPANRAEIMIRCTIETEEQCAGVDNSLAIITDIPAAGNRAENILKSVPIVQIEIQKAGTPTSTLGQRSSNDDDFDFTVNSCLPSYLPDMTLIPDSEVTPHFAGLPVEVLNTIRPASLERNAAFPWLDEISNSLWFAVTPFSLNGEIFQGYNNPNTLPNITVMEMQKVYQFTQTHGDHPLHIHINHMQLMEPSDDGSNYHLPGDYVDTLSSPCPPPGVGAGQCLFFEPRPEEHVLFRMFTDRYFDRVVAHCHIMDHSDNLAFGEMFILEDEEYLATFVPPKWEDNCNTVQTIRGLDLGDGSCDNDDDVLYIAIIFVACQICILLIIFLAWRCMVNKKDKRRRESSIFEEPSDVAPNRRRRSSQEKKSKQLRTIPEAQLAEGI